MKVLSANDISSLVRKIHNKNENIDMFAGSGDDKRSIIKKGFKIKHVPSGLVYTVIKVILSKDGEEAKILCQRPGRKLLIPATGLEDYERQ
jgi:hypothetical protein